MVIPPDANENYIQQEINIRVYEIASLIEHKNSIITGVDVRASNTFGRRFDYYWKSPTGDELKDKVWQNEQEMWQKMLDEDEKEEEIDCNIICESPWFLLEDVKVLTDKSHYENND